MAERLVLVVGVGSELRRDDAVGRVVAARIDERRFPTVQVRSVTQLVPELAEAMAKVDRVVFVDAALDVEQVTVSSQVELSGPSDSHHGDPGALLKLARMVYGTAPETFVVTVPVADLGLGFGLTAECESHVDAAIERVEALVRQPGSGEAATLERPVSRSEG